VYFTISAAKVQLKISEIVANASCFITNRFNLDPAVDAAGADVDVFEIPSPLMGQFWFCPHFQLPLTSSSPRTFNLPNTFDEFMCPSSAPARSQFRLRHFGRRSSRNSNAWALGRDSSAISYATVTAYAGSISRRPANSARPICGRKST